MKDEQSITESDWRNLRMTRGIDNVTEFKTLGEKEQKALSILGNGILSMLMNNDFDKAVGFFIDVVGADRNSAERFVSTLAIICSEDQSRELQKNWYVWMGNYAKWSCKKISTRNMKRAGYALLGGFVGASIMIYLYNNKIVPPGQGTALLFLIISAPILWGICIIFPAFFEWIEFSGAKKPDDI